MAIIPRVREDVKDIITFADGRGWGNAIPFGDSSFRFDTKAEAQGYVPDENFTVPMWYPTFNRTVKDGKVFTDVIDTDYLSKLKEGQLLPMNPCTSNDVQVAGYACFIVVTRRVHYRSVTQKWASSWRQHVTFVRPSGFFGTFRPTIPWSSLSIDARAQLAGGYMDLLTSVSEVHKTIGMVVGFKRKVREAISSLIQAFRLRHRRKKFRTFSAMMDELTSFWLEYRYGWRILFYEYNSIVETINAIADKKIRRSYVARHNASSERKVTQNGQQCSYTVTQTDDLEARYTAVGGFDFRGPVQIDPITTAWELLPLSFVIDMFWNVGDVLAVWSPTSRVEEEACCRSTRMTTVSSVEFTLKPDLTTDQEIVWNGIFSDPEMGPEIAFREEYIRTKDTPSLSIAPDINLSALRALDLGSLGWVFKDLFLNLSRR